MEDIGFVNGELKYVAIHFRSVMKKRLPFSLGTTAVFGCYTNNMSDTCPTMFFKMMYPQKPLKIWKYIDLEPMIEDV